MSKMILVNEKNPDKLPKGFKKKWIKALRSGKYRQGQGVLYKKGSHGGHPTFCCLGVAGDICGIDRKKLDCQYFLRSQLVPNLINGLDAESVSRKLASLNDQGVKFSKIADYIEEKL